MITPEYACIEYERWAEKIADLSSLIFTECCPQENQGTIEDGYASQNSCFGEAKQEQVEVLGYDVEASHHRPKTLDELEKEVADCPSCMRLIGLIRERKAARRKLGTAKRRIRTVGKRLMALEVEG